MNLKRLHLKDSTCSNGHYVIERDTCMCHTSAQNQAINSAYPLTTYIILFFQPGKFTVLDEKLSTYTTIMYG